MRPGSAACAESRRTYIYKHIHIHKYICMCVCVYIYVCVCVYIYICIYAYIYTCVCVCECIHIYIYTHVYIFVCMYTHTHTHIHTHTHTHTHTRIVCDGDHAREGDRWRRPTSRWREAREQVCRAEAEAWGWWRMGTVGRGCWRVVAEARVTYISQPSSKRDDARNHQTAKQA